MSLKLKVRETEDASGRIKTGNPLYDELIRLSAELEDSLNDLESDNEDKARTDDTMRRAKAKGIVSSASKGRNADERAAIADSLFAEERLAANLAEGKALASLERVRGRRAQLSAFQTLVSAIKQTGESIEYNQIGIGET